MEQISDEEKAGKEAPISVFFRGFAGDGAPFVQTNRLKDADEDNHWDNVIPLIGMFHFFMATCCEANEVNKENVAYSYILAIHANVLVCHR
jgi:hypothetical protein